MAIVDETKSKRKHKNKNKISFNDEIITKDIASKLIEKANAEVANENRKFKKKKEMPTKNVPQFDDEVNAGKIENPVTFKKKKKHSRKKAPNNDSIVVAVPDNTKTKDSQTNKIEPNHDTSDSEAETHDTSNMDNAHEKKKEESIRSKKRKHHMELMQAKKLRSELNLQQKCLNYLSLWKHNKSQWKFEKLKQIWLQQNMYDDAKVPDEFWDTLVKYFNSAKGQAKLNILNKAVKVVDSLEDVDDEDPEKISVKYVRARSIVQNLQE